MRYWLASLVLVVVLGALAWVVPDLRRGLIKAIVTYDAAPGEPAPLPGGSGPSLGSVPRTRVVLIDGLAKSVAVTLPQWSKACARGATLDIDVGFPTVSLPVEAALWTGLTQQQSGIVYRSGRPLVPPLDASVSIPAKVPGSIAIAEAYGYIVRSLGFTHADPPADPKNPAKDLAILDDGSMGGAAWKRVWQERAHAAVASDAPLVFVHVLRVDTAGHQSGMTLPYLQAAYDADAIAGALMASAPDARWFLLSDHGHLASGGHGGEEPHVRIVQGCIVGPGIPVTRAGPVHIVDIAYAIASSTGVTLSPEARGRPLTAAMTSPLGPDQGVPALGLTGGALAMFLLVAGLALSAWGVRKWWVAPWWFAGAIALLVVLRGMPSLSTPMIYKPEGRDMYITWLPALPIAFAATLYAITRADDARTTLMRVTVAQLALPFAATAAALTACGAWGPLLGAQRAPVVPLVTAWTSPLLVLVAHGSAAVGLAVLVAAVRRAYGRRGSVSPPSRSEPSAAEHPRDAAAPDP